MYAKRERVLHQMVVCSLLYGATHYSNVVL